MRIIYEHSNGKYNSDYELFAEPISDENVQLMGEMIALRALRTVYAYDNYKVAERLFNGLIRDFHHMNEPGYIVSDGYDCVQAAICFLLQFKGRYVSEIYGNTKYRKNVTIKNACYGVVDLYILNFRRKAANSKDIDVYDNKKAPSVNIDYFEETDYTKADEIVEAMHLTQKENDVLNCYLGGMKLSEVALFLAASKTAIKSRRACIRDKYINIQDISGNIDL